MSTTVQYYYCSMIYDTVVVQQYTQAFNVFKDSPCCSVVEVLVLFGRLLIFGELVLGNVVQVYGLRNVGMVTVECRHAS